MINSFVNLIFANLVSAAYAAEEAVKTATTATTTTKEELAEKTLDATQAVAQVAQNPSIFDSILHSDPVVKLTLLLLILFSVGCWAIIFLKSKQLSGAQKSSQNFWQTFSSTSKISDILSTKGARNGPLFEIFQTGQATLSKIKKGKSLQMTPYLRNVIMQRMNQSREEEVYKLEQYVSFLATTASVAPFIGLFGTVWGILTAFMAIGKAGSSSLATVGPYISEALVATAVGLFAAIPAVIAYNYFVNKIKIINKMIDLFMDDFVLKSEQELAS